LKNYNFSEVNFTFLYHFRVLLLISDTFWSILGDFKGSEKKTRIQDGGSKMASILDPDVIVLSYDGISLCCGPQRRHF